MTGLLSRQPSQSSVRVAIAACLLLLAQSAALLLLPELGKEAHLLILVMSPVAGLAFGTALIGLPEPSAQRWRQRHGL